MICYNALDTVSSFLTLNGKNSKTRQIGDLSLKLKKSERKHHKQLGQLCARLKTARDQLDNHFVINERQDVPITGGGDDLASLLAARVDNHSFFLVKNPAGKTIFQGDQMPALPVIPPPPVPPPCPPRRSRRCSDSDSEDEHHHHHERRRHCPVEPPCPGFDYVLMDVQTLINDIFQVIDSSYPEGATFTVDDLSNTFRQWGFLHAAPTEAETPVYSKGILTSVCYEQLKDFVNRVVREYTAPTSVYHACRLVNVFDTIYAKTDLYIIVTADAVPVPYFSLCKFSILLTALNFGIIEFKCPTTYAPITATP